MSVYNIINGGSLGAPFYNAPIMRVLESTNIGDHKASDLTALDKKPHIIINTFYYDTLVIMIPRTTAN